MAVASLSSGQSVAGALWGQIQQQQAQRSADQAEQRANALQQRAREAQGVADRAQENARSLKVESNQAQGEATQAKQGLAERASMAKVQAGLSDLHEQISSVLKAESTTNTSAISATSASLVPVLNSLGQSTGTLVNVTA